MTTLVIAEAGVNHNGDLATALRLVDAADDAGADIVKFQAFSADRLVTTDARKAGYQTERTNAEETQHAMLRGLELCHADFEAITAHCRERGIGFLSTGFDVADVDMLVALGMDRLKVPSGEITNLPYLRHLGGLGLPVILSTGMASLTEVTGALAALQEAGTRLVDITVLHCTTEYPAPMGEVNLRAMETIRTAFAVAVGYSDHTLGHEVALAAVTLGAMVIEKHITLDRTGHGPDHAASMEPAEFATMVRLIRNVERALGDGVKAPQPGELDNRSAARRSVVAARPIRAGEIFTSMNLTAKRPGTGISPMRWDDIIGSIAARDYAADERIDP